MSPPSRDRVPDAVRQRFDAIVGLIDGVCRAHLTEEYASLGRELATALARKRPSPLLQGRAPTWACGITYTLGTVNFLFDPTQRPTSMGVISVPCSTSVRVQARPRRVRSCAS